MSGKSSGFALLCAGILLAWTPHQVGAAENPATPAMNCAAIRQLVRTRGAVVLYTGPHLYDRYVDHNGFCPTMMRAQAAWVPARDNPQCFIGYTCEQTNVRARR